MEEETPEQPLAIEILPPTHTKHWETKGGDIYVFRLRLMSTDEIKRHGLEKYATHLNNDTHR